SGCSRAVGSRRWRRLSLRSGTSLRSALVRRGCVSRSRPFAEMSVDAAYAEVERLTRRRARNFAYGIMVLPREKRRAIAAIYAFAREVDDVADGGASVEEKRTRLEALRDALDDPPGTAMHVALTDARARFGIPRDALSALVDGGLQDLDRARYANFDELRGYCEKVAGGVGVACVA